VLWRNLFAFRSCRGLFWFFAYGLQVWRQSQFKSGNIRQWFPSVMLWVVTFPLNQELPNQTQALFERFILKHILDFINRNAFSINLKWWRNTLSRQIYAVSDLCCIVSLRSVESVGGVFDPVVSSAIAICYGHATSLIWMQQSLGVTTQTLCMPHQVHMKHRVRQDEL